MERESGPRIAGVLEDYAFVGNAALDAWEATGDMHYYEAAEAIAEVLVQKFYDPVGGGFFDTEARSKGSRGSALSRFAESPSRTHRLRPETL